MRQIQLFKSLALFFAIYLPLVTVGIPLHKHYCNGILEDASLLFVAHACQEESLTEVKKDCCSTGNSCHNSEPAPEKEEEKDQVEDDEGGGDGGGASGTGEEQTRKSKRGEKKRVKKNKS